MPARPIIPGQRNRRKSLNTLSGWERQSGICREWEEYCSTIEELVGRSPEHILVFDTDWVLKMAKGLQELLAFAGIPAERQVAALNFG
ncbi:MAG TPA: hypothetical protein PLS55_13800 [Thermogutta sp.]|mgnify:CR=1 FL=1|nr:hypothetical protein [Thermogutta sp.]